ncbi:MAG TPA: cytochrome C oxidase subunit IV family protein [Actinomycetota bacterium]|jgi:cytochrome c oxidase subunit 4
MGQRLDEFHEEAGERGIADPREAHAPHKQHPSAKEYIRIGIILAFLTGFEVWLSYSGVRDGLLVGLLMLTMVTKFALVVLWFMHLRFDDPRYSRFFLVGLALAACLYLIVLLLFGVFQD